MFLKEADIQAKGSDMIIQVITVRPYIKYGIISSKRTFPNIVK